MILNLPYFRFCQIIETVNKRLIGKQKLELKVKELITKFSASMLIAGSFLSKEGKMSLIKEINKFSLLGKEDREEKEMLSPTGSFEKLAKYFGGKR